MNYYEDRWEGMPTEGQYIAIKSLQEKHPCPDLNLWGSLDKLSKTEASRVISSLKSFAQKPRGVKLPGSPAASLTYKQRVRIMSLSKALGWTPTELKGFLQVYSRLGLVDLLTPGEASKVIASLEARV